MMNNLKIVMINTDKIKPYHRNVRFNDETVMTLCEIIPKVGFNVPILIDKNNVIIKGHSRWKAGVKLGLSKLPCIISENDDETNKLDRLTDNKIQEFSKWDTDLLNVELASINLDDIDVTDFGFDLKIDNIEIPTVNNFEPVDYTEYTNDETAPLNSDNSTTSYTVTPVKDFITEEDIEKTVSKQVNQYGSVICTNCGATVLYKK